MNYVGTTPNPPRALPASAPGPVAPTPIDRAAGEAPRREQSSAEHRPDHSAASTPPPAEPAIKIAGVLTALFAGEIVDAVVERAQAAASLALRLPEGRLVPLQGSISDAAGTTLKIRLARLGDEPTVELLTPEGKSRTPVAILRVRLEQSAPSAPIATATRLPMPHAAASIDEPLLSGSGIVSLPAMMGRVAVHVPANAAYLHTTSGLPETTLASIDPVISAESDLVPARFRADWDALWAALEASPITADRVRDLLQPREPLKLAGGLLFLATILRHGSLRHWLGDEALGRLSAVSPQNLRRAQSAFDDLTRQGRDAGSEGWRTIPLALVDASAVQPMMLYVHRPPPRRRKTDPDPADGATRFMLDLVLSATGPLRIDGLFRQKLLDLIIRTERAVPRIVSGELRALYAGALSASGLSGHLEFQTVARLPPAPAPRAVSQGATLTA